MKHFNRILTPDNIIVALFLILPYLFFVVGSLPFGGGIAAGDSFVHSIPVMTNLTFQSLWNPFSQCGTFMIKDLGFQPVYPPALVIMKLLPNVAGYTVLMMLHYSCAGIFTYILLRHYQLDRFASFIGGLCFMFSGFLTAHLGHHTMINAAIWLPLLIYLLDRYFDENRIVFLILSSFTFSMSILADYIAVPMYIGMIAFPYMVFRIWFYKKKEDMKIIIGFKQLLVCCIIVFGGSFLICAIQIIPVLESLSQISRQKISYEFFTGFSFLFKAFPMLIFPFFFGHGYTNTPYFGFESGGELSCYMGLLPPSLALIGFMACKKESRLFWFWAIIFAGSFTLTLGRSNPLYSLLYHVPIYNMFRVPARNFFEVHFAISVLAGFAIHYIALPGEERTLLLKNWTRRISICLVLVSVGTAIAAQIFIHYIPRIKALDLPLSTLTGNFELSMPQVLELYKSNIAVDSPAIYIPLILTLITVMMLFFIRSHHGKTVFRICVSAFIFIDLFLYGAFMYKNRENTALISRNKNNQVYNYLSRHNPDLSSFRTLPTTMGSPYELYPNFNIHYGVHVFNGYNNIWGKDYLKLGNMEINGQTPNLNSLLNNSTILSIHSVRYIITTNDTIKQTIERITTSSSPETRTTPDGQKWQFWETSPGTIAHRDRVQLRSSSPGKVCFARHRFDLEPNTDYFITFKARSELPMQNAFVIEFCGEGFESDSLKRVIYSHEVSRKPKHYSMIINSGIELPQRAYLRLRSSSDDHVVITNLRMEKIRYGTRDWTAAQNSPSHSNIYIKRAETAHNVAVYENINFLPRARFVKEVRPVRDFNAVYNTLWFDTTFNPATTALVESFTGITSFDPGVVNSTDYTHNDSITLKVKTGNRSFLTVSDSFYKGWEAYIDGEKTRIYKTNGIARGIIIDGAGEHAIVMKFRPKSFYAGFGLTIVTIIAFIAFAVLGRKKTG